MMTSPGVRSRPVADPQASIALLRRWLEPAVPPDAAAWIGTEIERQQTGVDERRLGIAVGLVGRKIGRPALSLPRDEIEAATKLRAGWQPAHWSADEMARIAILLATYAGDDRAFAARVDRLCTTAEINEHVSYLKGFAIFPAGDELIGRAREGVRSSAGPVFEAIACRNPYPFDYFDEAAWNQMVVKSVFVGAPLDTIVGLNERRNPELVLMLRDFVAERHAAGRPLPDAVHRYIAG